MQYKIVEGSQTGHCCFDYTIIDTTKPIIIDGEHRNNEYQFICECFYEEHAKLICDALNSKAVS